MQLIDCKFGTTHDALATFACFELPARGLLELVNCRFRFFAMTQERIVFSENTPREKRSEATTGQNFGHGLGDLLVTV